MYKEIINNTLNGVLKNSSRLTKALLIPFLILLGFDYINLENQGSTIVIVMSTIVSFLISVTIAITTHRILLLEDAVPTWGLYKFGAREFKFLFYSFLLVLFMIVPSIIFSFIPYVGLLLVAVYIVVVVSRLSLVFPSISIDEDIEFSESWNYTKNHKWLVVVTVVIFPTLIALIVGGVYTIAIAYLVGIISEKLNILYSFLNILYSFLNIFITVFMISALSSTYKYIKAEHQEEDEGLEIVPIVHEELINEDTFRISILDTIEEDFAYIKHYLYQNYEELGFTSIVIDKEESYMLKNSEDNNSYVGLSKVNDKYIVEVYNTAKPYLGFLDKYKN
jgi:hypothetical protein